MIRKTRSQPVRWRTTLARKRPMPVEPLGILWRKNLGLPPDRFQNAEAPPDRLGIHAKMDVRGIGLLAHRKKLVDMSEAVNVRGGCVHWQ